MSFYSRVTFPLSFNYALIHHIYPRININADKIMSVFQDKNYKLLSVGVIYLKGDNIYKFKMFDGNELVSADSKRSTLIISPDSITKYAPMFRHITVTELLVT
ncbi:hypothetical protein GQR58_016993 [Nymphon striatum]|nr:hypothetical protein GQR58_016993 [Nymphon striatum]